MNHTLKSTGETIIHYPWTGDHGKQPWQNQYHRYIIPNSRGENHLQFIRKDKVKFKG